MMTMGMVMVMMMMMMGIGVSGIPGKGWHAATGGMGGRGVREGKRGGRAVVRDGCGMVGARAKVERREVQGHI